MLKKGDKAVYLTIWSRARAKELDGTGGQAHGFHLQTVEVKSMGKKQGTIVDLSTGDFQQHHVSPSIVYGAERPKYSGFQYLFAEDEFSMEVAQKLAEEYRARELAQCERSLANKIESGPSEYCIRKMKVKGYEHMTSHEFDIEVSYPARIEAHKLPIYFKDDRVK